MVLEEARITDEFLELDEGTKSVLNAKLQMVQELLPEQPEISFTYEKYKGDAIINKTYIKDCISKKVMINNGDRPKYPYWEKSE